MYNCTWNPLLHSIQGRPKLSLQSFKANSDELHLLWLTVAVRKIKKLPLPQPQPHAANTACVNKPLLCLKRGLITYILKVTFSDPGIVSRRGPDAADRTHQVRASVDRHVQETGEQLC